VPDTPEQMQEKLDELGETIDAARRQAEQDDLLGGPESEPLFEDLGLAPTDEHIEEAEKDRESDDEESDDDA
jgi:hypothetical protein